MKKLMIVLLSLAFVGAFVLPSFAADWNFYGSSRMSTFYEDFSDEAGDDDDLTWTLQGNARIGATVQGDVIGGGFEYGHSTGGGTPTLRKMYGTAQLGGGTLLLGQTYTPFNFFYSNQVFESDNDLLAQGGVYNGREPMIQYECAGFEFALVEPQGSDIGTGGDVDYTIPQAEAKYSFTGPGGSGFQIAGVYHTFEVNDEDVDAFGIAAGGDVVFGPLNLAANIFYGQNSSEYGQFVATDASPLLVGNDVTDDETVGGILVATYTMNDQVTFEAGYGYVESEYDTSGAEKDDESSVYAQATINIVDGFFIVPEVGYFDYMDDRNGNDEGDSIYYGLKWQINF
ncbi:MAG: hypothetical protein K9K64_15415 [Desulfohalobiaceae bacterium]|nr:hypothetical protein [Desulfohalobiaceae bacterium]